MHIRALGEALDHLFTEKRVKVCWRVMLTHSDSDNPDTTFSLEPDLASAEHQLADLQADALVIAEQLDAHFWKACTRLQEMVT